MFTHIYTEIVKEEEEEEEEKEEVEKSRGKRRSMKMILEIQSCSSNKDAFSTK